MDENDTLSNLNVLNWDQCEQKICALRLNGKLTLKVLYIDHGNHGYVLMPVNNEYKPITLDPESSDFALIGVLEYTIKKW